jgi:uncharacterized membrane protein (UPF0127 family)
MKYAAVLTCLVLIASGAAAQAMNNGKPQALPTEPLVIDSGKAKHRFTMEVAKDEAAREIGLMYRKSMQDGHGMIFVFDDQPARAQAFWMRNTLIPLDIIFVGADGRVLNIAKNARPMDETPLPSTGPARAVVEINGGLTDKLHIKPGDKVIDEAAFATKP